MTDGPVGMASSERTSKVLIWAVVLTVMVGISTAYFVGQAKSQADLGAPGLSRPGIKIPLPDFAFTERSGRVVQRADLLGHVWIADLIFTSCAGPCPVMSAHMRTLQHDLAKIAPLRLVSFSVDPARDTPEVLRAYADRYEADRERWLFLTGPMEAVFDLAIDGFKITVEQARQEGQIIHDTRFILVDPRGDIRGYYDSASADDLQRLRQDAAILARSSDS